MRIRKLPDTVANQIAAGEVVERPASVVKELLENAIDAQATRVEVHIEDGGVGLIRVTDDGIGMSREDAELCLERHATSKIQQVHDLESVTTLGFRGEAIPSIASVCKFTLTTRPREQTEGTRIIVEGGKVVDVAAFGAAPGTTIDARDLFFNVPARRKFLKRPQTEMSHIGDAVERLALANPQVAFRLVNDGRIVLDVPQAGHIDPKGWLGRILSKKIAEHLYEVPKLEVGGVVSVRGWAASPERTERTTKGLHVFVNGRYVRDRTIQHAIADAYRTLMERGRHPVVVLWLEVEPSLVDVNVHPQKTEVRFERTREVHRAVTSALSQTLGAQPWVKQLGYAPSPSGAASYARSSFTPPHASNSGPPSGGYEKKYVLRGDGPSALDEHRARLASAVAATGRVPSALRDLTPSNEPWSVVRETSPLELGNGRFSGLVPIGQVLGTYLVCQGPGRMVMIDQHAAHERIAFEKMKLQHKSGRVEVQPLLVPQAIELDAGRAEIAGEAAERLKSIGFELEPFGGATWMLKSVPVALSGAKVEQIVLDVLDELKDVGESTPMDEAIEAMLSCAACHTVVRAGDRLGKEEIGALLRQMDEIDFGAHCPHGRPVFVEWSESELAKLFHRS